MIPGIAFIGCEVPTTVYWLTGFTGVLSVTVTLERPGGGATAVPVVGIVRFNCCPATSWP